MRVAAVPASVPQGEWMVLAVETEVVAAELSEDVRTIDARGAWYFARLHVLSRGGDRVVLRCVDPSGGLPDPPAPPDAEGPLSADGYELAHLPGERASGPVSGRVTFPLAAEWGRIVPGTYEAFVEVAVDETAFSHPAQGDWRGTLRSAPFELMVVPAETIPFSIEVPSASLGGDAPGATVVRVEVRNGFAVGYPSGSGPPDAEMAARISKFARRATEPWVLFESSKVLGRRRRRSASDDYARTLLRLAPSVPERRSD
jgi:hypothetical protein